MSQYKGEKESAKTDQVKEDTASEKELPQSKEEKVMISHYLDEKGILLQRRGEISGYLKKKATDKATRTWLNARMKSYKGTM